MVVYPQLHSFMTDKLVLPVLSLLILLLSIFWYVLVTQRKPKKEPPLPPGPNGLPIVGYLPFLGTNLHRTFAKLAHKYGPIYKLWLGNKLCVVLTSPSLIQEVVRDQDIIFANRDPPIAASIITYGSLDIAWSSYGSYWRDMRKLFVREVLSGSNLEASCKLGGKEVRRTIRDVHNRIGEIVDIGELAFRTEFNVVTSMLWGNQDEYVDYRAEFRIAMSKIVEFLGKPNISDIFPALARFDFQGIGKEMERVLAWVDRIFDKIIDERMQVAYGEMEDKRTDFLQILLDLKDKKDAETKINLTQIKAILMDIVTGGTDTTATMVEWTMAEILKNPKVMEKVQEELKDVVGMNSNVEVFHLPKLHYVDAVVKETFRLHPALPLLVPRCPSQSRVVGGYTIPKDTKVLLNVWAIHRDPQIWENPMEFKPERFLYDTTGYTGNNFQYLPFGSGRRICPGVPLAQKMVNYMVASLLHSFDWELPKGETLEFSENFGIVVKKSKPLLAIPSQRLTNLDLYA